MLSCATILARGALGATAATSPPTTFTATVPQHAAGDGRRVVELTFHPPALITGAINTSLYHANGTVHMLSPTAAFLQNFFAIDERHVFGQLLWYGGEFEAADKVERKYSMYLYTEDGGLTWGKPPQTPTSPGGAVPAGWLPTIDTSLGGWAFRPRSGAKPGLNHRFCANPVPENMQRF